MALSEEYEGTASTGWLDDALKLAAAARVPNDSEADGIVLRCMAAGKIGADLAKLRLMHQRVGFALVPVGSYLRGLSGLAGVRIGPLLGWFRIGHTEPPDEQSSFGVARFCYGLGMDIRHALNHLRLSYMAGLGATHVLPPMMGRGRGGSDTSDLVVLEEVFVRWETELSQLGRATWSRCEAAARQVYTEGARGGDQRNDLH